MHRVLYYIDIPSLYQYRQTLVPLIISYITKGVKSLLPVFLCPSLQWVNKDSSYFMFLWAVPSQDVYHPDPFSDGRSRQLVEFVSEELTLIVLSF